MSERKKIVTIKNGKEKILYSDGGWEDSDGRRELMRDGIYDKKYISNGEMRLYDRFFRVSPIDPYNTLTGAREYLFFTKPDLNLFSNTSAVARKNEKYSATKTQGKGDKFYGDVVGNYGVEHKVTTTSALNPDLANYPFFIELSRKYPKIGEQLQYSLNKKEPFMKILSNSVKNTLDLPDISTRQVETAQTVFGTSIQYEADDYSTDDGFTFDLEFEDTKEIEVYMLFKTWHEYLRKKSFGLVEPVYNKYRNEKVLHDQIAIFKFIVADDGETIVHYSKLYGCRPQGVPRSTFSDLGSSLPIRFNVNWRAEFVEDMDPMILADFNALTSGRSGTEIELFDEKTFRSNYEVASFAQVTVSENQNNSFRVPEGRVYQLKWYK